MRLKEYIWVFENELGDFFCKDVIKLGTETTKHFAYINDGNNIPNKKIRDSKVCFLSDYWIKEWFDKYFHTANKNAGWNFQFNKYENFQFTEYKKNQHYNWHNDMFPKPYKNHTFPNYNGLVRKISCSVLLNDPKKYEGGDFEIGYTNNFYKGTIDKHKYAFNKTNAKQGSVIVFPSFIWHRVTPVTKGTRYSLVSWTLGKPYV